LCLENKAQNGPASVALGMMEYLLIGARRTACWLRDEKVQIGERLRENDKGISQFM
jgi:hypothetical protein